MQINEGKRGRKIYTVKEENSKVFSVVKVLNYYSTYDEAMKAMIAVVLEEVTEEDLLEELTESNW